VTEIIFAVLYVSIMVLTRCYKTTGFLHLYLQFFYLIYFTDVYYCTILFTVFAKSNELIWENEWPPYWNSAYGFHLNLPVVIGISFCICIANFT